MINNEGSSGRKLSAYSDDCELMPRLRHLVKWLFGQLEATKMLRYYYRSSLEIQTFRE